MKLSHNAPFFNYILEEYKNTRSFDNSRIRQDLTKEEAISTDYRGREVYELIQNAEDQNSEYVDIILNSHDRTLTVSNGGHACEPFSQSGFSSIMMSDMSPKFISKRNFIGHKGLGFRSLLNWSDEISIRSNGVCCTFSRQIARSKWAEIKNSLSPALASAHEDFARSFPHNCPVAMLSTPYVTTDHSTQHATTITIKYRPDSYDSICQQLNSLSGKSLLFLKNIQRISISTPETGSYAIFKDPVKQIADHIFTTATIDRQHHPSQKQQWCIYRTAGPLGDDKKYEIAIAYDKTAHESGKYIYSFFPTRVPLDKPFVLHATFDLNTSRNGINISADNDHVQQLIADAIVEFAEYLASSDTHCENKWLYHSFLSLPHDFLPITSQRLSQLIDSAKVFPTVAAGYQTLANTLHYSESMAGFLASNVNYFDILKPLASHLICGFTDFELPEQNYDTLLGDIFSNFSRNIVPRIPEVNQINTRVNIIEALVDVKNCTPMPLLVDEENNVIDDDAFVNIGESIPYLPDDLKINYVNEKLTNALISRFGLDSDKNRRSLVQLLSSNKCVDVSELNISAARKKIITYSRHMSAYGFRRLMFALFYRFVDPHPDDSLFMPLFSHEHFRVLAADKSYAYPSEVVLNTGTSDLPLKWQMLGSVDEWIAWFRDINNNVGNPIDVDRITRDNIMDFFITKVGISTNLPLNYVLLDNNANDYINTYSSAIAITNKYNFYSSNLEYKNNQTLYNRSKVIKTEFIDYLINDRQQSISQIIKLIINDPVYNRELNNTTLYYYHNRSIRSEIVKIGYSLYLLRQHPIFAPLKHYVVSEHMYLLNDSNIEKQLNALAEKPEYALYLARLGARERMSDLSLKELYDVLISLPAKQLQTGIQKTYRLLREAINSRREDPEFKTLAHNFAATGKVYVRSGGQLDVIPAVDAYYWDNDQLPRRILDTKPKLDIGNRVGEDSVKSIFGVRLAKEIEVNISTCTPNQALNQDIARHLHQRVRYLLAYRLHNSREISQDKDKQSQARIIRGIKIHVHSACTYTDDGKHYTMAPGDMIATEKEFHVVSAHSSIDEALRSPKFCENITEAICISLKVSSSEMANCFRRIIKDSIEENRYIANKEISPEEWADVDKALGLSAFEKKLWSATDITPPIDIDRLSVLTGKDKSDYLRIIAPGIVVPDAVGDIADLSPADLYNLLKSLQFDNVDFLGSGCLHDYYADLFKTLVAQYDKSFFKHTYTHANSPDDYFVKCRDFKNGRWYQPVLQSIASRIVSYDHVRDMFASAVKDNFGVEVDRDIVPNADFSPEIKSEYLTILADNNLDSSNIDQDIMSLALFDGYTAEFTKRIQKHILRHPETHNIESQNDLADTEIIEAHAFDKPIRPHESHSHGSGGGSGYKSEKSKIISGREAEVRVLRSMKNQPDRYSYVKDVSRNLDTVNGDDNLHYDIEYKLAGSDTLRYLDVKCMQTDTIFMSVNEYKFALANADVYDLAIFHNGKVHMVLSPFAPTADRPPLTAHPSNYLISISLK